MKYKIEGQKGGRKQYMKCKTGGNDLLIIKQGVHVSFQSKYDYTYMFPVNIRSLPDFPFGLGEVLTHYGIYKSLYTHSVEQQR